MSRVTGKVPRAKINFGDFGVNRDLVEYGLKCITLRDFLQFEILSEGMDNDLRRVTFLVLLETESHVVRQNKEFLMASAYLYSVSGSA